MLGPENPAPGVIRALLKGGFLTQKKVFCSNLVLSWGVPSEAYRF